MKLIPKYFKFVVLSALLFGASASSADNISAFTSNSFEAIKQEYQGKEFLVGLWSIDCPPCLVELGLMSGLLEHNPDLPFVLISTDPIEHKAQAIEFLTDFNLSQRKTWMFADNFVEKLRYSIDPQWFGELPRSYFFDAQHNMSSHSGILTQTILQRWFSNGINY